MGPGRARWVGSELDLSGAIWGWEGPGVGSYPDQSKITIKIKIRGERFEDEEEDDRDRDPASLPLPPSLKLRWTGRRQGEGGYVWGLGAVTS
jgi:hypothetical protein